MHDEPTDARIAAARQFLKMVCDGRVDAAYEQLVAPGFRHHNPWFRGDAASLRDGMADNVAQFPDKAITIHKILADGDEVAVLSCVQHTHDGPRYAVMHIFRFEGGRIAELWDLGQEIPADAVNENGMF